MTDAERVEVRRERLERACRERGNFITGDGRIGEEVVAALLGLSPGTLANQRAEGRGLPHFRLGGAGHRVTYDLADLAAYIEGLRCP